MSEAPTSPRPGAGSGESFRVDVIGDSLAALATAARLAKRRHHVRLVTPRDQLAPEWRPCPGEPPEASPMPQVLTFPAPWRDLFKKSGRILSAALALSGLELVPAPDAVHVFSDGTRLQLGGNRGQQYHQMEQAYGAATAQAWRDLVDSLEPVWQLVRALGLETSLTSASHLRQHRAQLWWGRTVADLAAAQPHPHLGELVTASVWALGHDPARTPAFVASRLSVQRTFGRWMLTDTHGDPVGTERLLDLVADRVATRRVEIVTDTSPQDPDPAADATVVAATTPEQFAPWLPRGSFTQRLRRSDPAAGLATLRPALRPVRHWSPSPGDAPQAGGYGAGEYGAGVWEQVEHLTRRISYTTAAGTLTHDWGNAASDPVAGPAWQGQQSWLARLPVRLGPRRYSAGAWGRGGNDLAGILMSGALATYDAHFDLTGVDTHPSNKDQ